jgi:V/A-type H+-transporting ATPase subunit I
MKKLQILALEESRERIIKALQGLGSIHLTDYTEKLDDPQLKDLLQPHPLSPHVRKIASQNIAINRLLDLFERHDPEQKEGFIKAVFAPLPPKRVETREIYGTELIDTVDKTVEEIEEEVEEPVRELEGIEEEIAELRRTKGLLDLVLPLEIDLSDVGDSHYLSVLLGTAQKSQLEGLRQRAAELTDNTSYVGASEISENRAVTLVICLREHASAVISGLRRLGWERIEIEGQEGKPRDAITSIDTRLAKLAGEKKNREQGIINTARKWRDELRTYQELLATERQREDSQIKCAKMEHVVAIEGWIPKHSVAQAQAEIMKASSEACVIEVSDPDEHDDVPVRLENPRFFRSFELLTRLYGLPAYNGVDPTIFLAPGFLLFFSIMLTDALYGVIALLLGTLLIRGGGKYNETIKDGGIILASAGGATIIIGALSGGWFGEFGLKLPLLEALQVFDPMIQVTGFLAIALTIGLAHVNVGVIINVVGKLKGGQRWQALSENLWFLFVQPGIILFLVGQKSLGGIFIIIALMLLFAGHKAMSMFQVTGFMGDILSYARLMALGLCTTGIAMTVNVLSNMLYAVGSFGIILAVFIFLFGHLFNFLINAMGSFVHGLRLHYVEFFTKFYQSGGTEFKPLAMRFEIVKIK